MKQANRSPGPGFHAAPFVKGWIKNHLNGAPIFWRGESERNGIALTFDDGPHAEFSPLILDILKKKHAVATFFVNGNRVAEHPDIVRRMADEGHEIGNHTYSHKRLKKLSLSEIAGEIGKTRDMLQQICGKATLMRPPWGALSLSLLLYTLATRERVVLWTHDSGDSSSRTLSAALLADRVRSLPLRNGDILLFHDDYTHTVDALPAILDDLQARGFRLSGVSELIHMKT